MMVEEIARVCHEANRAYCAILGDNTQPSWEDAPEWQRRSAVQGVVNAIEGASPEESHANWLRHKRSECWVYGPVKDPERRQHPCMVPYHALPEDQKRKDHLFVAIVRALTGRAEA